MLTAAPEKEGSLTLQHHNHGKRMRWQRKCLLITTIKWKGKDQGKKAWPEAALQIIYILLQRDLMCRRYRGSSIITNNRYSVHNMTWLGRKECYDNDNPLQWRSRLSMCRRDDEFCSETTGGTPTIALQLPSLQIQQSDVCEQCIDGIPRRRQSLESDLLLVP